MILYNVTVNIDPQIQQDWLNWMRSEHIPEVLGTGCFKDAKLSRINAEEEGGFTYSIMYFAESKEVYETYQRDFAPEMQRKHTERYSGKFAAFRTVLDVIEVFEA